MSRREDPVQGTIPKGSISKHLVSHNLTPSEKAQCIQRLLASKEEQRETMNMEPGDALRLVELLDEVLRTDSLDEKDRTPCVRCLARVCGWHRILPNSVRISDYQRISVFGGGGHSAVWTGTHNGQKVMVKALNVYTSDDEKKKRETARAFCKEVVTWQHLDHPNILPLIGATMVDEQNKRVYEIVSDFMENGDIMTFTKTHEGVDRLKLLQDVASGLSYLHSQSVVHGDLKGQNILVNAQQRACLADFGLTRILTEFSSSGPGDPGGTVAWMSPEMLWPEEFDLKDAKPTKESDVYALGILIYEVVCGYRPYKGSSEWSAAQKMRQGTFPQRPEVGFTDSLWSTLESCWQRQREKRPDIDTVLERLIEASRA